MSLRDKLFSFDGRLRRRDWWVLSISMSIAQLLASFVAVRGVRADLYDAAAATAFTPAWLVVTAVALVFVWPQSALAAKRAHDRDLPGSLGVTVVLASYVPGFARPEKGSLLELGADVLMGIAALAMLVLLGVLRGTPGANRYGSSPKAEGRLSDVFG